MNGACADMGSSLEALGLASTNDDLRGALEAYKSGIEPHKLSDDSAVCAW